VLLLRDLDVERLLVIGGATERCIVQTAIDARELDFKVTILTDTPRYYTPYLPRPTGLADSPNAIVRASAAIAAFEEWAYDYQQRNTYKGGMGTIVPKASINAIRSGYPYNLTSAPQVAAFYIDTRILPGANPMDVRDELRRVLKKVGIEGTVELFVYRPGFEAKGAERLIDTIKRCHAQTFSAPPAIVGDPVTSMWRDTNAFNELGIPAISYAPRAQSHAATKSFKVGDLTDAALVYARMAMDLCNQERGTSLPLGAHPDRAVAASIRPREQEDNADRSRR